MLGAHRSRLELLARLGYAARGVVNLLIGLLALLAAFGQGGGATGSKGALQMFAMSLLFGLGTGDGEEQSARDWTRWLLAQPFGRWLVTAVGLAIIGAGLGMAHKAWSGSFARHLAYYRATAIWVMPLGRLGYAARAVVFLVIGGFLVLAAYQADPSEAHGLGGALLALQKQPFGRMLFALVAFGLAAFGTFEFAKARYRRIDTPDGRGVLDAARARLA